MKLHLLRHAKTEKQAISGRDFDRSLMEKGSRQSKEIAKFLENKNWNNTLLFCSEAKRTRETFAEIQKRNSFNEVSFHQNLYLAENKELLDFIWKLNSTQDLFILGHNDGLSELASYFCGEEIHLKTCSYVCITFEANSSVEMSRETGMIVETFRPEV